MASDLIPQPHGGALRSRPPAGNGSSWKRARKEVISAYRSMSLAGAVRLGELIADPDSRVAVVAVKELNQRIWGNEAFGIAEQDAAAIDMSKLTGEQQLELAAALATVRRLAALASGEIQGMVEGTSVE